MAAIPSRRERPGRRLALALLFLAPWAARGAEAPGPALRLVHLSDTHCAHVAANPRPRRPFDPHRKNLAASFDLLAAAVQQINERVKPDLVVVTGDLVDRPGDVRSLRRAKALLDRLTCPWIPVIGNHDGRAAWRQVFGPERLSYALTCRGWRFLVLDSSPGRLDEPTLAWLRARLDEERDVPTAVLLHHPPVLPEVYRAAFRRFYGVDPVLRNREAVLEMLKAHKNMKATFAGHCHVGMDCDWGGMTHTTAPALVEPGHFYHLVVLEPEGLRRTVLAVER